MCVSYRKLHEILSLKGISLHYLYKQGIISDLASRQLREDVPVNIKHIAAISLFLNKSIDELVDVIPED